MIATAITKFDVPGVPLKLAIYTIPENPTLENLPNMVLPAEVVGSGAAPTSDQLVQVFIQFEKQDGFDAIPKDTWPTVCNHIVTCIDVQLRTPACMAAFGKRLTLHDRTTNGVLVDSKDAAGNDIKVPPAQNKGKVAVIILKQLFRPLPKTMVVLDTELDDPKPKFSIVIALAGGVTITTVDGVLYKEVLANSTQPTGKFTLNGIEYDFFMAHPFVNLRQYFDATTIHATVVSSLFRLASQMKVLDFDEFAAAVTTN